MLIFSTMLPIKPTMTNEDFIRLAIEWNQKHINEEFRIKEIEWKHESKVKFGDNPYMEIDEDARRQISLIRYERTDTSGVIWDIDFIMNFSERKMLIQLSRSYTEDARVTHDYFYAPGFIKLLIEQNYLEEDEGVVISNYPHCFNNGNIDDLCLMLCGKRCCRMPIVYISAKADGEMPIDAEELAYRLRGIAHVVYVDPQDRKALKILENAMGETGLETDGEVGIYYPSSEQNHQSFGYSAAEGYDSEQLKKTVDSVMQFCGSCVIPEEYDRISILHEKMKDELAKLQETNEDVQQMGITLAELYKEVSRLRNDNEKMQEGEKIQKGEKCKSERVIVLDCPKGMIEFYADEWKAVVVEALMTAKRMEMEKSRTGRIIGHILDKENVRAHKSTQEKQKKMQEKLHQILDHYTNFDDRMRNELEKLGFVIISEKKHVKFCYMGDAAYSFTIAKTPSDRNCAGTNSVSDIIKTIF